MPGLDHLLRTIAWTLIHSLWIGIVLSLLAGATLVVTRKRSAALRYGLLLTLLAAFVLSVVLCFIGEWQTSVSFPALLTNTSDLGNNEKAGVGFFQHYLWQLEDGLAANSSWIVMVWGAVLLYKACRITLDLVYVTRIRSIRATPVVTQWQLRLDQLKTSLNITRHVSFVESAVARVPMVAGHLKPVILFPVGVLAQLPASQVEAILLHELAHIRRHDYLVNFFQRVIEGLFFFNPGILWISGLIRNERENCCDDLALHGSSRADLVNALVNFKEYAIRQPAYAVTFFNTGSELMRRMTRLVYKRNRSLTAKEAGFLALNLLLLALVITGIKNTDATSSMPAVGWYVPSSGGGEFMSSESKASEPEMIGEREVQVPATATVSEHTIASAENAMPVHEKLESANRNQEGKAGSYIHKQREVAGAAEANNPDIVSDKPSPAVAVPPVEIVAAVERLQVIRDRQDAAAHRLMADAHRAHAARERAAADIHRSEADKYRQESERHKAIADAHRAEAVQRRLVAEQQVTEANRDRQRVHMESRQPRS